MVIGHLKQTGKVRKLGKWVPHELTENQKHHHFEVCLLLFYIRTTNHFSNGLWHRTKSGFFMTTGDNQLSGWTKKKLQSTSQRQTCTKKKVKVTIWWPAACLIHYSFLNASESEKCASKLMRHTKTPQCLQPALVNRESPVLFHDNTQLMSHNHCFKSWKKRATKFCLICHINLTSCQPTTTSSSISTTFCRENASKTSRTQKMLSKSLSNLESWIFTPQE